MLICIILTILIAGPTATLFLGNQLTKKTVPLRILWVGIVYAAVSVTYAILT